MCEQGFKCQSSCCLWTLLAIVAFAVTHVGSAARSRSRPHESNGCEFPPKWTGTWFQKGVHPPIRIEKDVFSFKGKCIDSNNDMFFIEDSRENCRRCVVIYEKHPNVLQYRETYCYEYRTLSKGCGSLNADAPLYSLFRIDAETIPCPLRGAPYTFSYSRGGRGECANPVSTIDSCTDNSRLLFRFQACADVIGTESSVEELRCLASWKDGSTNYLVGKISNRKNHNYAFTDDNSYRCFVFDYLQEKGEIQMSQSADATCDGLVTPWEGSRTMRLLKSEHPVSRCHYPSWVTSHRRWHSLDGKKSFTFSHKNNTFMLSHSHKEHAETTFNCIEEIHSSANYTKLISYGMSGCENGHVCMKFFKRHDHIIEVQIGNYARNTHEACHASFTDGHSLEYATLVASTLPSSGCPHLTGSNGLGIQVGKSPSSFTTDICSDTAAIVVGCRSPDSIQFLTTCASVEDVKSFRCHGHWEENGRSYLVTGLHNSESKYCFVYWNNDKTTHLTGIHDTCRRKLEPGVTGIFTFNISSTGQCDSLLGANSSSREKSRTIYFTLTILLVVLFR